MDSNSSYAGTLRERVRWAAREGVVLLGILAFWLAAFLALLVVVSVASFVVRALRLEALMFVYEFLGDLQHGAWAVLAPLVAANASLYVLVRAGTVLLDHYRD